MADNSLKNIYVLSTLLIEELDKVNHEVEESPLKTNTQALIGSIENLDHSVSGMIEDKNSLQWYLQKKHKRMVKILE